MTEDNATRAELLEALASQVARLVSAEAERDRLRAGLFRVLQYENKCDQTGQPCDASMRCCCSLEADSWCEENRA